MRFQHTEKTADIYNSMIREYREISCDSDLEKIGITYEEYSYSGLFMDMLRFNGVGLTEYKNIAEWAKRKGCYVTEIKGGWRVSLQEG